MLESLSPHHQLAYQLSEEYARFPQVEAIALGGSASSGTGDASSDIDLYVYCNPIVPLSARQDIVSKMGALRAELNLTFWDVGDEWYHAGTGIEVDMMFWDPAWIEGMIDQVLVRQQASLGYTTCFWNTIVNSLPLYDRSGWYTRLQERCRQPYPEGLRRAIISQNHALLRAVIPSYLNQITKAVRRSDPVSVNHRLAAFLASYFDILFALNRVLHPGEKRLLQLAQARCALTPAGMPAQVEEILRLAGAPDQKLIDRLHDLVDQLDKLLRAEQAYPDEVLKGPE